MSATKHTPAPWDHYDTDIIRDARGNIIAEIYVPSIPERGGISDAQRAANASLIAAAPKLLAALKDAVACIEYCRRAHKDPQSGTGFPIELMWKELIAEAEGPVKTPLYVIDHKVSPKKWRKGTVPMSLDKANQLATELDEHGNTVRVRRLLP